MGSFGLISGMLLSQLLVCFFVVACVEVGDGQRGDRFMGSMMGCFRETPRS